jgi:hypothetical protein
MMQAAVAFKGSQLFARPGRLEADPAPPLGTAHVVYRFDAAELEARRAALEAGRKTADGLILAELALARAFGVPPPPPGASVVSFQSGRACGIRVTVEAMGALTVPGDAPMRVSYLALCRLLAPLDLLVVGWLTVERFRERNFWAQGKAGATKAVQRFDLWPLGSLLERERRAGSRLPRFGRCRSCRVFLLPVREELCGAEGCAKLHAARLAARAGP